MTGLTILIVEDSYTMRSLVRQVLEAAGATVYEAVDGAGAERRRGMEPPAVVIVDLLLPDADGVELARELKTTEGWADVPIVAFSAYVDLLAKAGEMHDIFAGTLEKPFKVDDLVALIERVTRADVAA